jgi:hypothetical protein
MNYFNKISKIKRSRLIDLQRVVNNIKGHKFISDDMMKRWNDKLMSQADRSSLILAKLSTAGLSEEKIKKIYEQLFPWWTPYFELLKIFFIFLVIFLTFKTVTFINADRIYSVEFQQEINFDDGSKEVFDLFTRNTLILGNRIEGKQYLQKDSWVSWLFGKQNSSDYDSSKWDYNKVRAEKLIQFFTDFKQNEHFAQILNASNLDGLHPINIYQAIEKILPNINEFKIDLSTPNIKNRGIADNPISLGCEKVNQEKIVYFFCTLNNKSNQLRYLQIDNRNNAQIFIINGTNNLSKIVWLNNTYMNCVEAPKLYLLDNFGNHSKKLYLKQFDKNHAYEE